MREIAVLIVGAGRTGLTLAVDLARRGVGFRLIEVASTPFAGSRGKGIQPRTLEIFDDLGVVEAILPAGQLYPRFRLHAGPLSLRVGGLSPFRPQTESVPYPNTWMVPQWRTEAILRERLHTLGGDVEFGNPLATFTQNEHSVEATLTNGDVVRTDFLVGADGGHSTVRKALGLRLEGEAVDPEKHLVADVEVAGMDRHDRHVWPFAKGGIVSLCPLPNTSLFQFVAKAKAVEIGVEGLVRKVTGCRVERIAWSSVYQPAARMVERYRVGRVLLAGDAAHLIRPQEARGSTPASRMPTTWVGSWRTSSAAVPTRCSTRTNPSGSQSSQPCSG